MYLVKDLYKKHGEGLGLEIIAGKKGLKRHIKVPEAHRPGLGLAGYLNNYAGKRILIFGKVEIEYLRDLLDKTRIDRLKNLLKMATPAVIVARRYRPLKELVMLCEDLEVPLFRASMTTMNLLSKLTYILTEEFSPSLSCHGTLVEVFGVGLVIQGDSAVGKSEAALGLIERGHRLISDDIVKVKMREGSYLEGSGVDIIRHHMEIRGIGIINVADLYGALCVRDNKRIDVVVKLEIWDDQKFYDRLGIDQKFCEILKVKIPYHELPVKPGRDVVLLLETVALNHRLKQMGYNSAKEFNNTLLQAIAGKQLQASKMGKKRYHHEACEKG